MDWYKIGALMGIMGALIELCTLICEFRANVRRQRWLESERKRR